MTSALKWVAALVAAKAVVRGATEEPVDPDSTGGATEEPVDPDGAEAADPEAPGVGKHSVTRSLIRDPYSSASHQACANEPCTHLEP